MAALVAADPRAIEAITAALNTCAPVLAQRELSSAVSEALRSSGVAATTVSSVLRTLLAVYSVLRDSWGLNAAEAAEELVKTIREDGKLGAPSDGWEPFQRRIEQLLANEQVLGLSAKASSIASDTERHVHGVRVFTDARPIYGENATDGPKAFAILHTLKIDYFEGGEDREWFITLDGDDLESLQGVTERALTKERSLKAMLQQLKVPVLSWKAVDDGK